MHTTVTDSLISPAEISVQETHNIGTIVLLFGVQTCTVTTGHVFFMATCEHEIPLDAFSDGPQS